MEESKRRSRVSCGGELEVEESKRWRRIRGGGE